MKEKILRNYDNIMLFIGFTVTFYLLLRVFSIAYDFNGLSEKKAVYRYTYRYVGEKLKPDDLDWLEGLAGQYGVIVNVEGCMLKVGNLRDRNPVTVCLHSGEGSTGAPNSVIVGKSLKPLVSGSGLLLLEDQEFTVSSFLKNDLIDDNSVRVFWGNLSDDYKSFLCSTINERDIGSENCYFYLEGPSSLEGCRDEIVGRFGEHCLPGGNPIEDNYLKTFENKMMIATLVVLLMFAVVCVVSMADLWILRRRREYLICIALGFGRRQMLARMFGEMGRTASGAFLLTVFPEVVRESINGSLLENGGRFLFGMIGLAAGTLFVVGTALLIPYRKIDKTLPTQGNMDTG